MVPEYHQEEQVSEFTPPVEEMNLPTTVTVLRDFGPASLKFSMFTLESEHWHKAHQVSSYPP